MIKALVVTPVKDSIETTLSSARAVANSSVKVKHIIFNDFSTPETQSVLESYQLEIGYELVNLKELTDHPSPNYKLVLQIAQQKALEENIPLIVVESDVVIGKDTIERLLNHLLSDEKAGLIGAITVDEKGKINFPYQKFKGVKESVILTGRSLSFCCTLFSLELLRNYNFSGLNEAKDWYDTFISKKSLQLGFHNILLMDTLVLHKPHASRPWKQLKYTHPLKYYFLKFWKGLDKI
ncbi:MAG: glycosyltransferase [Bacteroidales bacterium]